MSTSPVLPRVNLAVRYTFPLLKQSLHLAGISRCWLKSKVIAVHVCLGQVTIKVHCKMCSSSIQHDATDATSSEWAYDRCVNCRNVHRSSCLWTMCSFHHRNRPPTQQHRFGSVSTKPHDHWALVTTPAQEHHITCLQARNALRTWTKRAGETAGSHRC